MGVELQYHDPRGVRSPLRPVGRGWGIFLPEARWGCSGLFVVDHSLEDVSVSWRTSWSHHRYTLERSIDL